MESIIMIDSLSGVATGLSGVASGAVGWIIYIIKSLDRRIEKNIDDIYKLDEKIENVKDDIKKDLDIIGDKQDRMITYLIMVSDNEKAKEVLGGDLK